MKENKFTLFVTITLLIFTLLLALQFLKDYLKTKESIKEKTFLEKKFNPSNVSEIYIYGDQKVVIKKEKDFWYIVYPFYDLAYSYKIEDIVSNLYQPTVNEVIKFSNDIYNQFFSTKKVVHFRVNNYLYTVEIGQKNNITNEYYVYIKNPKIDKIFLVDYFSYNYLDSKPEELRLTKILNIDPSEIPKIDIYCEGKKYSITKKEIDKDKFEWYLSDNDLASKEYMDNLFTFLNNYEIKSFINLNIIKSPYLIINLYYKGNPITIEVYKMNPNEVLVKSSIRKQLMIMDYNYFKNLDGFKIIEDKPFSYDLANTQDVENITFKTSFYSYTFQKKNDKWFNISYKDKDKTADVSLFLSALSNLKYRNYWNYNPLKSGYELYNVELKIKINEDNKKKYRTIKFFLYNPDHLAKGSKVYEINSLKEILKNLIKIN